MFEQYDDFHPFLYTVDGSLSNGAKRLSLVRSFIDGLPPTKSTFSSTNLGINTTGLSVVHFELCKVWPFLDKYGRSGSKRRFVNPNYSHCEMFSDLYVVCDCGVTFEPSGDLNLPPIDDASEHADDCLPFQRFEARAELYKQRFTRLHRLTWLGWRQSDIAKRFGVSSGRIGSFVQNYDITLGDFVEQYRIAAGNTSAFLITYNPSITPATMADVYGVTPTTVRSWLREYTEYEAAHNGGWSHTPSDITVPSGVDLSCEKKRVPWRQV